MRDFVIAQPSLMEQALVLCENALSPDCMRRPIVNIQYSFDCPVMIGRCAHSTFAPRSFSSERNIDR